MADRSPVSRGLCWVENMLSDQIADRPCGLSGLSTFQILKGQNSCRGSVGFGQELADRPAMSGGPSATLPRLTGEFAAGDSGLGLGWGLFLEVPGSLGSSLW